MLWLNQKKTGGGIMGFSVTDTLKKAGQDPNLKKYKKYFIFSHSFLSRMIYQVSFSDLEKRVGWNASAIARGLDNLKAKDQAFGNLLYSLYTKEECAKDREKKGVNLLYIPSEKRDNNKPFVILCAGGGYTSVCTAIEALPTAERLNKLGYDVFCLSYRVGKKKVLPKPLEDLAKAVEFTQANLAKFGFTNGDYVVGGFSAGGNLVGLWGSENHGYKYYGQKKPKALFPVYAVINNNLFAPGRTTQSFIDLEFGKGASSDLVSSYNIDENMTKDYPPCYIVVCRDDPQVPFANSVSLKEKLDGLGIKGELQIGDKGGHGFGDGTGTDVADWVEKADAFVGNL